MSPCSAQVTWHMTKQLGQDWQTQTNIVILWSVILNQIYYQISLILQQL